LYVWFVCVLYVPSVLWYCWLGLLTCKNRLPYNVYCVGGDVKHCSIQCNFRLKISPLVATIFRSYTGKRSIKLGELGGNILFAYQTGGTAAAAPPPSGLATLPCGSCPLVTPYYCRLGDLLCLFCVYRFVCHYCLCMYVFSCFRCLLSPL